MYKYQIGTIKSSKWLRDLKIPAFIMYKKGQELSTADNYKINRPLITIRQMIYHQRFTTVTVCHMGRSSEQLGSASNDGKFIIVWQYANTFPISMGTCLRIWVYAVNDFKVTEFCSSVFIGKTNNTKIDNV